MSQGARMTSRLRLSGGLLGLFLLTLIVTPAVAAPIEWRSGPEPAAAPEPEPMKLPA